MAVIVIHNLNHFGQKDGLSHGTGLNNNGLCYVKINLKMRRHFYGDMGLIVQKEMRLFNQSDIRKGQNIGYYIVIGHT